MNKERRRALRALSQEVETLKSKLEDILNDEQDYYDNMPENLQGSQRGMDSEAAIEQMEEAIEQLEEAIETIDSIM